MNTQTMRSIWPRFALLVVGAILLSGCTSQTLPVMLGTRDVVRRELDFIDFDELAVDDAFAVQVRQGDEFRVIIEMDQASLNYLEATQNDSRLELGLHPRQGIFWNMNEVHRAEITMPTLVGVAAHNASRVTVSGFHTDAAARFEIADASWLEGAITTGDTQITVQDSSTLALEGDHGDVEIHVSNASNVTLVGEGHNVMVRATNASRVNLGEFHAQDADTTAHDASHITVDVAGRLDAEAQDASTIVYTGNPTLGDITSNTTSSIRAR